MTIYIWLWVVLLALWLFYRWTLVSALAKLCLMLVTVAVLVQGLMSHRSLLIVVGVLLGLSHGRVIANRYGPKRMRRILNRSWRWLVAFTIAFSTIEWLLSHYPQWLASLIAIVWLILGSRAFLYSVLHSFSRFKLNRKAEFNDLPTVTLAIPARNETHALTDCLRSAVASSYPKLEVLVLDDCSQDSTPDIIRSFAHDGIRFISGQQPASGWIGKNHAYQSLLNEASGDIVLFAGVDTRFSTQSVDLLIKRMLERDSRFMSVMPYRRHLDLLPSLVRPLRYYYQLAFSRQPFMNSVWLAQREWLIDAGGFEPHKHAILPEESFAERARDEVAYDFVISTDRLGITSRKRVNSLFETAIRTLYPQSDKDPVIAWLKSAGWMMMALVWLGSWWWSIPAFTIGSVLLGLSYIVVEMNLQPSGWFFSGWLLPLSLASQSLLELVSMTSYEFGRVDWKGRNVCLPVMKQHPNGELSLARNRQSK